MRCLYCNVSMGLFRSSDKGSFCSLEHEELYRQAVARRLGNPYTDSNRTLESSTKPVTAEAVLTQDLAGLLSAVQADNMPIEEATPVAASCLATPAEAVCSLQPPTRVRMLESAGIGTLPPPAALAGIADIAAASAPQKFDSNVAPQANAVSGFVRVEKKGPRSDPRVDAHPIATVACLRNLHREMSCSGVAQSGAELEFNADCDFAAGEVITAQLPDQMVLAEVKRSQADGNRYRVSAECIVSISRNDLPSSSSLDIQVELLIKALCQRVEHGFPGDEGTQNEGRKRAQALERAVRILEMWQSAKARPVSSSESSGSLTWQEKKSEIPAAPETAESGPGEAGPPNSGRRVLLVATSAFVSMALVIAGFLQFRMTQTRSDTKILSPAALQPQNPPPHPPSLPQPHSADSAQIIEQPAAQQSPKPSSGVVTGKDASLSGPVVPQQTTPTVTTGTLSTRAAGAVGKHYVEIRALQSTWVGVSTDGVKVFGGMITKGDSKRLEYSRFGFLHVGNAAGVEIIVDGQTAQMDKPGLRLVEVTATGFRFVRWSNDDPPKQ